MSEKVRQSSIDPGRQAVVMVLVKKSLLEVIQTLSCCSHTSLMLVTEAYAFMLLNSIVTRSFPYKRYIAYLSVALLSLHPIFLYNVICNVKLLPPGYET